MKNHTYKLLFGAAAGGILLLASCSKNDSDPVTDPRDQYVGSWTTVETCNSSSSQTFTITVSKSVSDNVSIKIQNFYNLGSSTYTFAKTSGNSITIESQSVSGWNLHGSGNFSSGKINFTYYADDGVQKDTCSAACTKQ